jgi:DNA-binding IclR family transcriptional regulator
MLSLLERMGMSEKSAVSSVGLRRDMEILELLAGHGDDRERDGLGVNWIAQRLGREKSQVSRALRALEVEGMVERDPVTRRYRLGWRLFALAARTQQVRLVQMAAPFLRRLAAVTDEDTHLCVLRGEMVLTLLSMPSSRAYHRIWEGISVPLIMSASGRSLVADWHQDHVLELLSTRLPGGLGSSPGVEKQWAADIAHIRLHGYSVTGAELDDSAAAVSAPVRDHRGLITAAVSVSVTRAPVAERLHQMGGIVAETARQLSIALGMPPVGPFTAPPEYPGPRVFSDTGPGATAEPGHRGHGGREPSAGSAAETWPAE